MIALLATGLFGYQPFGAVVVETRCDLLEINTVYRFDADQKFTVTLTQLIAWEYRPDTLDLDENPPASPYRVLDWRLVKGPGMVPVRHRGGWRATWSEEKAIFRVSADKFVRSYTKVDLEVQDRNVLLMAERRGLGTLPDGLRQRSLVNPD